jgi:DnaK suppressor protein
MHFEILEEFRRQLLNRRRSLLRRRERVLADEQQLLAEREPDWEDTATAATAASVLASVGEEERLALARIAASLERMERGRYGECAACGEVIDVARLRAVPDTDRCARCAAAH